MLASKQPKQPDLAEYMARFSPDPYGYSLFAFDWGIGDLAGFKGPRNWQKDILQSIGNHISGPDRFKVLRIAIASGNGIGKSCLISMLTSWALDTCPDARVTITANTEPQLRTKTWPEITKWKKLAITSDWYNIGATSIKFSQQQHSDLWRADMVTWNEKNPSAFQGLHNVGKRILIVYDEASGIPKAIWDATSGSLTDENTEIIWLAFGNPINGSGPFRECFGSQAHRWQHYHIDSRTVDGTNKEQIAEWIADWGEDSDYVRYRVKGQFPRVESSQFIAQEWVARCRKYKANPDTYGGLPKILGVDVARFGEDRTVLFYRQGRYSKILGQFRGLRTTEVAERVIEAWDSSKPDAVVVDADGIGAGVVDHLRYRGFTRALYEFHGAEKAKNASMYANRRAEIWGEMREAIQSGMEIPDDPAIEDDLCGIMYGLREKTGQIQLEKKSDMHDRGLQSPDLGDALAMTFAVQVRSRQDSTTDWNRIGQSGGASWMM